MLGIYDARNLRETASELYWIDVLAGIIDNRENGCITIPYLCLVGKGICVPLVGILPFVHTLQHPPYLAYRVQLYTSL